MLVPFNVGRCLPRKRPADTSTALGLRTLPFKALPFQRSPLSSDSPSGAYPAFPASPDSDRPSRCPSPKR